MIPGVTIRKVSEKRASCGLASLLSVCQAMSIAITTVLPEPVAILKRHAGQIRGWRARSASRISFSIQVSPYFVGDLGDVDGRLQRFDLAEEELCSRSGLVQYASRRAVVGVVPR